MPKYIVRLSAAAIVSTSVEVEADDREHAWDKAMSAAYSGDLTWSYDCLCDENVQVESLTQEGHAC